MYQEDTSNPQTQWALFAQMIYVLESNAVPSSVFATSCNFALGSMLDSELLKCVLCPTHCASTAQVRGNNGQTGIVRFGKVG